MTNNVCADEVLRSVASDLGLSSLIRRLSVLMLRIILLKDYSKFAKFVTPLIVTAVWIPTTVKQMQIS